MVPEYIHAYPQSRRVIGSSRGGERGRISKPAFEETFEQQRDAGGGGVKPKSPPGEGCGYVQEQHI